MALAAPIAPSANTLTLMTTIAAGKVGVLSQVIVTNSGLTTAAIRVAISATTTPTAAEYIAYDIACPPNDSISVPVADFVDATFNIMVRTTFATVSFRACGQVKDA